MLAKTGWVLLGVFAGVNAISALRYSLPEVPFPASLDNFFHHRRLLALHAFCGAIALLAGPLQLLPAFRERHWTFHRRMGWIYCGAVLAGSLAALRLAWHAQTGRIASAGFFLLGVAWLISTALALRFILRGNTARHRRWMIRSYSLTAAAITLRLYLPLSFLPHFSYAVVYPAIAWLCWVPNLIAAEIYLHQAAESAGGLQSAAALL
ncbi:MAG TPA: DUF2306 domain-containing protein [Candidatus Methylomirabilis sp.]|nr:DUF2306 domain-containing protein [Candidatus Methylomirabilis sp.]